MGRIKGDNFLHLIFYHLLSINARILLLIEIRFFLFLRFLSFLIILKKLFFSFKKNIYLFFIAIVPDLELE